MLEVLENRTLLASTVSLAGGVLTVTGTAAADDIYISTSIGNTIRIADHNVQLGNLIPKASVKKIVVNLNAGNDYAFVGLYENIPTTLNGGDGADGLTG